MDVAQSSISDNGDDAPLSALPPSSLVRELDVTDLVPSSANDDAAEPSLNLLERRVGSTETGLQSQSIPSRAVEASSQEQEQQHCSYEQSMQMLQQRKQRPVILPSGDVLDAKNTLQNHSPAATAPLDAMFPQQHHVVYEVAASSTLQDISALTVDSHVTNSEVTLASVPPQQHESPVERKVDRLLDGYSRRLDETESNAHFVERNAELASDSLPLGDKTNAIAALQKNILDNGDISAIPDSNQILWSPTVPMPNEEEHVRDEDNEIATTIASTTAAAVTTTTVDATAILACRYVFAEALIIGAASNGRFSGSGSGSRGNESLHRPTMQPLEMSLPLNPVSQSTTVGHQSKKRTILRRISLILTFVLATVAISLGVACGSGELSSCSRKDVAVSAPPLTDRTSVVGTIANSTDSKAWIAAYIDNVTLTGRNISRPTDILQRNRREERALEWLIHDDVLNWTQDSARDQVWLQQRYAVVTSWTHWTDHSGVVANNQSGRHECEWEGITCQQIDLGGTLGLQRTVTEINLSAQECKGSISPDLALLSHLVRFNVSNNLHTGSIPDTLGRWTDIAFMDASSNLLSGTIPESIGAWSRVSVFDVSSNAFAGTFPSSLRHWTELTVFNIASLNMNSGLHGSVPNFIGNWTTLEELILEGNLFTGTLPSSIEQLTKLQHFSIYGSGLNGTLPQFRSASLNYIDVRSNHLTGTISAPLGNLSEVSAALFNENAFTGSMPDIFCEGVANGMELWADCQSEISCECCTMCE